VTNIKITLGSDEIRKKSVLTSYKKGSVRGCTIGMLLAMEGDYESVNFLLKHSLTNHDEVALGYAIRGDVERASKHISYTSYFNPDNSADFRLVYPYAFGGHFEQATKQRPWFFEQYRDTDYFFDLVIKGLADGGQLSSFAKLFAYDNDSMHIINAAIAISRTQYFTLNNLPYLIAHIEHSELRNVILSHINIPEIESHLNMPIKYSKLEKILLNLNNMMSEYDLNFDLAASLLDQGTRTWLLQAPQLIRENKIIKEIFWQVTSLCLGSSEADTKKVYLAIHDQLFRLNLTTEPVKNAKLAFAKRSGFTSIFTPAVIPKITESSVAEPQKINSAYPK
jgi:hypothetical protein